VHVFCIQKFVLEILSNTEEDINIQIINVPICKFTTFFLWFVVSEDNFVGACLIKYSLRHKSYTFGEGLTEFSYDVLFSTKYRPAAEGREQSVD